jgi:hypothetical protein
MYPYRMLSGEKKAFPDVSIAIVLGGLQRALQCPVFLIE